MLKLIPVIVLILLSFAVKAQINMERKEGGFLFMEGKDSLFFYQQSPKDKDGKYRRCNYVHPLYGPDDSRLTEDFPADHPHHRGVFWAWHQILIDNKPVSDGWGLENFHQEVHDVGFSLRKGIGSLNTTVDWKSGLWENWHKPYLQEKTTITIYPKKDNYRRIDFEIQLNALADRLSIGGSDDEKGYSGFSIRLGLPADAGFYGDSGLVKPANTAVRAGNTLKIEGSFLKGGKKGGVAIYSNPQNPMPSDSWIIRNRASMQNAVYPGRLPVAIPVGKPLVLKYSLLVFQGGLGADQMKEAVE